MAKMYLSRSKAFKTTYTVLNYRPVGYSCSTGWRGFLNTLVYRVRAVLKRVNPDELNSPLFEPGIDSEAEMEKRNVNIQYHSHRMLIDHNMRVLAGERAKAAALRKLLMSDVALVEDLIRKETNHD